MTWTALIWIYLWLAGMAGGAYLAAFAVNRFTGGKNEALLRMATVMGIPLAGIGALLLIFELGNPIRFWHLFTQFDVTSPMSMGTWILMAWVVIAVVMVASWWLNLLEGLRGLLSSVNAVLAAALVTYTGVLLAVSSQSLWAGTVLLPSLFVISAVSTGVAILVLAGMALKSIARETIVRLAEADAIIIVLEIAVMIGYVVWLATSSGGSDALAVITTGSMAAAFWVGVVLLALLIPFGLDLTIRGKTPEAKGVMMTVMTSSLCVIVGGLILRWVITSGGQL
ncbi:MAG: polysulfide reductase NrfD [Dehalococcoidales bacterium]|nr:MAG: polysulfide reductase NrfD [Dehalococcoidales bacterium]